MLLKGMDLAQSNYAFCHFMNINGRLSEFCMCISLQNLAKGFRSPNIYKTDYIQFADTNI